MKNFLHSLLYKILRDKFDLRKALIIKQFKREGLCLDIGCGKKLYKEFFLEYVGLDINREKGPDILGDFHRLPFKDDVADTVLLFDILEHTTNYGLVLEEAKRVAKGRIIISTLYFKGLSLNLDPEHKHCYSEELLRRALKFHRYKVLDLRRSKDIIYAICEK
ncbi:hypothetical protein HRbin06_00343 [archaeon HR06]|nr:hypothetical protein HRbin06_00343 [archaeon HR06]